jgi:hypothetical protein
VTAQVDHIVVAAHSLAQGVAWCEAVLGVTPGPGGRHPLMGTHNRLFKIATAGFPEAYFEIIAIDPKAQAPSRVRWFGLDEPALRDRVRHAPRLVHVVARVDDVETRRSALLRCGLDPGVPVRAGRDTPLGPLAWQILVRDDGRLLCQGAMPTLIQWDGRHPAQAMPDSGVALSALTLRGVPAAARDVLRLQGVTVEDAPASPALTVALTTPRGAVVLSSDDDGSPEVPRDPARALKP